MSMFAHDRVTFGFNITFAFMRTKSTPTASKREKKNAMWKLLKLILKKKFQDLILHGVLSNHSYDGIMYVSTLQSDTIVPMCPN